jgi:hypothetical protein
LPLIANGDFQYTSGLNKLPEWVLGKGLYTDFNKSWYINAAPQLIITMMITAFLPWVELCVFFLLSSGKILLDKVKAYFLRPDYMIPKPGTDGEREEDIDY